MRRTIQTLLIVLAAGVLSIAATPYDSVGPGNETVNYSYDGLGRLTGSTATGGINDTRRTGTCFDRAGNRTRYDVATAAVPACPTPTPSP